MASKYATLSTFQKKYFDQLAGYAVLQRLSSRPNFRGMGVYFSRHGHLEMVDVDCIYGASGLGSLLAEFPRIAERAFGDWREMQSGRV